MTIAISSHPIFQLIGGAPPVSLILIVKPDSGLATNAALLSTLPLIHSAGEIRYPLVATINSCVTEICTDLSDCTGDFTYSTHKTSCRFRSYFIQTQITGI